MVEVAEFLMQRLNAPQTLLRRRAERQRDTGAEVVHEAHGSDVGIKQARPAAETAEYDMGRFAELADRGIAQQDGPRLGGGGDSENSSQHRWTPAEAESQNGIAPSEVGQFLRHGLPGDQIGR